LMEFKIECAYYHVKKNTFHLKADSNQLLHWHDLYPFALACTATPHSLAQVQSLGFQKIAVYDGLP